MAISKKDVTESAVKKAATSTGTSTPKEIIDKINSGEIKLETRKMTKEEIAEHDSRAYASKVDSKAFKPRRDSESKTMGNTDQNACKKNVKDVIMFGEDLFQLLSKASSQNEGWFKSTKAFDTGKGCIVQVTTQQRNPDGSYVVAEAVTFVPGVKVKETSDGTTITGRTLVGVG